MHERKSSPTNSNSNMVGMNGLPLLPPPPSKQNVREGESDSHPGEYRMKKIQNLLFSFWKDPASPAFYKAWVSGKPQDNQQGKHYEDIEFSIRDRAQFLHFCFQHVVCSFFFSSSHCPTSPAFFKALRKGKTL